MQLLGSRGIAALAFALGSQILQYLWLLGILVLLWFVMAVAAFVLAIVDMVIAVRRPTRKREAVFALVLTSIALVWMCNVPSCLGCRTERSSSVRAGRGIHPRSCLAPSVECRSPFVV